jgi:hypothetical protein
VDKLRNQPNRKGDALFFNPAFLDLMSCGWPEDEAEARQANNVRDISKLKSQQRVRGISKLKSQQRVRGISKLKVNSVYEVSSS